MHARVVPIRYKAASFSDLTTSYETSVVPALVREAGLRSAFLISDPASETGFCVDLWESKAAIRESASDPLLPHLVERPRTEHHEVLVQSGTPQGAHFARVITLPVPGEHVDAALRVYKEEYLPLLEKQSGFLCVVWLADRTRGSGWGISFWSSREEMEAADRTGEFFPKVLSRLAAYFSAPTKMGYHRVDSLI